MKYYNRYFDEEKVTVQFGIFEEGEGNEEYHIMFSHDASDSDFEKQLNEIVQALKKVIDTDVAEDANIIFKRYFLSDAANQYNCLSKNENNNCSYAVSAVQQPPLNGSKVALWVYLTKGMSPVRAGNYVLASRNSYTHIWAAQMHGDGVTSHEQTENIFAGLNNMLVSEGCNLKDNCIRTWLFVHNVDINYQGVVEARKEYFSEKDMTAQTHYISSTGIEGRNNNPHALVIADAYSIQGIKHGQISFVKALSHLSPTYKYGVTFERGTVVDYGDRRHVFISGTASIDSEGEIVHPGDVLKQAGRAMENVEALLGEARSYEGDIAQMIVYLRDVADYKTVEEYFQASYPEIPKVIVLAPVCRPGWLIEIECIAVSKPYQPYYRNF